MDESRSTAEPLGGEDIQVQRIKEKLMEAVDKEIEQIALLLAGKADHELFGQTEFELREIVHRLGAKALEVTANERLKRGLPGC